MRRFAPLTLLFLIGCGGLDEPMPLLDDYDSLESTTTHDSDLSPRPFLAKARQAKLLREVNSQGLFDTRFRPARVLPGAGGQPTIKGAFAYPDENGRLKPGRRATVSALVNGRPVGKALVQADGSWSLSLDSRLKGQSVDVVFTFDNPHWKITGKRNEYAWQGPKLQLTGDVDAGTVTVAGGTENAKAAWIHEVYNRAMDTFEREDIPTHWWNRQLTTYWPADADYYAWGSVNLTGAEQWDVNGHEIGHALHDLGINGRMGGGQHKIDECYADSLAWSEGFATFVSGVLHLDPADPDAHFDKYLVPRRAPIQLENVPQDVCMGQQNEWRVAAGLWDLYDTHNDGSDRVAVPFKTIWTTLMKGNNQRAVGGANDALGLLGKRLPDQAALLRDAFAQSGLGDRLADGLD